jgi:NTP pyrophosphatase (non-canonical NTP hydrolase)
MSESPSSSPAPLTFKAFSAVNRQRCESPDGFNHTLTSWSTSDWFLAVLGELGEAANVAKKLNRVRDGIPGNKETPIELQAKLRAELGDAFVYLDLLAQSLGVNIGDAAVEVFNAKSIEIGIKYQLAALAVAGSAPAPRSILVDRDADLRREMRWYLDTLTITGDTIGEIRRSLFVPWASEWNGWVRDETAAREQPALSRPPTGSQL